MKISPFWELIYLISQPHRLFKMSAKMDSFDPEVDLIQNQTLLLASFYNLAQGKQR